MQQGKYFTLITIEDSDIRLETIEPNNIIVKATKITETKAWQNQFLLLSKVQKEQLAKIFFHAFLVSQYIQLDYLSVRSWDLVRTMSQLGPISNSRPFWIPKQNLHGAKYLFFCKT